MMRQTNHKRRSIAGASERRVPGLSRRALLALAAVGLFPLATAAQSRMRLSHGYPPGSIVDEAAARFARYVEEAIEIRLEVFPAGAFMQSREAFQALFSGQLESWIGSAPAEAAMKSLQVFDVPFLIRGPRHFRRIINAGLTGPLADVFAERGLVLVAPIAMGSHAISSSSRPVIHPSDLEGIKLNVRGGGITEAGFSRLGASTVQLPASEVFPASQAGFLDAFAGPIQLIDKQRLYEAHHFLSLTRHVYSIAYLVLNRDAASAFERDSLREVGGEISDFSLAASEAADQDAINSLSANGMEVNEIDPFEFEYTKKITYDLYLSQAPEAWEMLNFVEDSVD